MPTHFGRIFIQIYVTLGKIWGLGAVPGRVFRRAALLELFARTARAGGIAPSGVYWHGDSLPCGGGHIFGQPACAKGHKPFVTVGKELLISTAKVMVGIPRNSDEPLASLLAEGEPSAYPTFRARLGLGQRKAA